MGGKFKLTITAVRRRTIRLTTAAPLCAPCAACGREVETLTRGQAAEILETGELELNEFIAGGRVHAIPVAGGRLRVCKESLFPQ